MRRVTCTCTAPADAAQGWSVRGRDDQGLNLASFSAKVDGAGVTLGQGADGAMGNVGPLLDGAHVFTASIRQWEFARDFRQRCGPEVTVEWALRA